MFLKVDAAERLCAAFNVNENERRQVDEKEQQRRARRGMGEALLTVERVLHRVRRHSVVLLFGANCTAKLRRMAIVREIVKCEMLLCAREICESHVPTSVVSKMFYLSSTVSILVQYLLAGRRRAG
jgi:hypothetical protein